MERNHHIFWWRRHHHPSSTTTTLPITTTTTVPPTTTTTVPSTRTTTTTTTKPTTTTTTVPVTSGRIWGANYGHNFAGHTYDSNLASADLNELKAAGVVSIRIYIPTPNTGEVAFTQQLALLAKSKGFQVVWGMCTGGSVTNAAGWTSYLASLDTYAAWANSNGIDYFTLGNEEEFLPLPASTIQGDIRNKAAALKKSFPNLKLTYAAAAFPANVSAWLANTGVLDNVSMNVYVDFANITSQLASNPKMSISEWNTDNGIAAVNGDETAWAAALVPIRNTINNSGVHAHLFVIRGGGGGIDDSWSMWLGTTRRAAWKALIV